MADLLTGRDTASEKQLNREQSAAKPEAKGFVIHPAPSGDTGPLEDGIYSENAVPYMESVIREESANHIQISCVLICGNLSLLSDAAVQKAAESYRLVLAGAGSRSSFPRRNVHYYDTVPTDEQFRQLFDAFDIDAVWYISGYADGQDGMHDEYKQMECIMDACVKNAVAKLIVVSSVESLNFQPRYDIMGRVVGRSYASGAAFAVAQMENFIRYYARSYGLKTILLRTPYLASEGNASNYLGQIFSHMLLDGKLIFPYCPENKLDFLSVSDLIELLMDVSEESADETAAFNVTSGYHYTWADLEGEVQKAAPDTAITYEENVNFISIQSYSIELKRKYGFTPMDDVLQDFGEAFQTYQKNLQTESWGRRVLKKVQNALMNDLMGYLELVAFFFLAEFLVRVTDSSVHFQYVDIRLFYVLIMGTIYGTQIGILAGILAGIALFFGYREIGINETMLFYNIDNWLPFVLYLMTGAITGYTSMVRRQKNEFLQKEHDLLREKYLFLNNVYHKAIENKSEYKRQILGYKDSFGVIFQAVQKLDSVLPQEIFMNGIQIMEGILNNYSIAIYTIDDGQRHGRLAACSGELLETLTKSIEIPSFLPVYATVQKGEVWKNSEFIEGMPMYAYGILEEDKLSLMIFVYDASPEQMSLYYLNLFSILCSLIKLSFIRALEYQRAIEKEKYFPDTLVVIPSYFEELLNAQKSLMDAGLASYALIRFETKDKAFLSEALKGLIRNSDVLGADEEGSLFLILTQINAKSIRIVEERLARKGLVFEIVSGNGQL